MPWRFKWGRDDFVLWDLRPHCGKAERLGHADGEGTCRQGMAWTKVQWPEKCGQAEWTPWWVMWKGGMLLKRRVELCLQAIKCSKEAAWLLANAEGGIEDYRMERKRPQHQGFRKTHHRGRWSLCTKKPSMGQDWGGFLPTSPRSLPWLQGSSQSPFSCQIWQLCPEAFWVHCSKALLFSNLTPQPVHPKEKEPWNWHYTHKEKNTAVPENLKHHNNKNKLNYHIQNQGSQCPFYTEGMNFQSSRWALW